MSTKNIDIQDYLPAQKRVNVSVGQTVSAVRELQNISQMQLATLANIPLTVLREIESDLLPLDVDRAKLLARALKVHPAVLVFPGWEIED